MYSADSIYGALDLGINEEKLDDLRLSVSGALNIGDAD